MRIAYVHTGLWPSDSPGTTFTTENAVALAGEFEQCSFLVKRNHEGPPEQVLEREFGMTIPPRLRIESTRPRLSISNSFFYRWAEQRVREIHADEGLDAVVCRNVTFLPHMVHMGEELGFPTLFESHNFYADLSLRDDIHAFRHLKHRRLELQYLPQMSALICLLESQKQLYQSAIPNLRVVVARTGIHTFHRRDGNGRFVTYIGSLDDHKGVDVLLRAAQRSESRPPVLIVGGKHKASVRKMKRMAARLAPDVPVTVTGWIDKVALRKHLSDTALGVLPLKDTFFNRHLTSPLKLFDYYSHGIPVIAADLPTLREIVDDGTTGVFFTSESVTELADRIDELWPDEGARARMSRSIYDTCTKYLWSERARSLATTIRELKES